MFFQNSMKGCASGLTWKFFLPEPSFGGDLVIFYVKLCFDKVAFSHHGLVLTLSFPSQSSNLDLGLFFKEIEMICLS